VTRVKICGITNEADALAAVAAGADALGFVFAESPRRVTVDQARAITRKVPLFVATVGVFVDEDVDAVTEALRECGLSAAQLHGSETTEEIAALGPARVIKGFRVESEADLAGLEDCPAHILLVEPRVEGKLGGPGVVLERELARQAVASGRNIMLAGGLDSESVYDVVCDARPYAVDVSSGVEAEPGRKDHAKLGDFLLAVRTADAAIRSSETPSKWG
jgi:phosphoribosylanthranilate isomerase